MSSVYASPGQATLVLERLPEAPHEPESVVDDALVGFDAFFADHRLYGWVRLSSDRLTDLLNDHEELALVNVQVERLSDGKPEWHDRLVVARDRLVAVRAGGPRGDPTRRLRTRLHSLIVQAGPYLFGGHLHAPPGVDPLTELDRRPPMTPLSSGWLEYWTDGHRHDQWVGTILFNRHTVDRIEVVDDEDVEFETVAWRPSERAPG